MKKLKMMMFAVFIIAAGCKSGSKSETPLSGHEWKLKVMTEDGVSIANPQGLPTLLFTDSTALYGFAGCNRFFGTYTTGKKNVMTIKPGGVTMMYCPDMNFEDRYMKALHEVASYSIQGKELTLADADNKLTLVYELADTTQRLIGVADDSHGCNAAAGYTWSEVRSGCVRLFEDGIRLNSVTDTAATLSAFVIFAVDSLKAEVFLPTTEIHSVLERRTLPAGGYAWNQEDDDTLNVRLSDGKWIIEKRGEMLYSEAEKK